MGSAMEWNPCHRSLSNNLKCKGYDERSTKENRLTSGSTVNVSLKQKINTRYHLPHLWIFNAASIWLLTSYANQYIVASSIQQTDVMNNCIFRIVCGPGSLYCKLCHDGRSFLLFRFSGSTQVLLFNILIYFWWVFLTQFKNNNVISLYVT